ncbi:MBL fold metallo-hydrolase [Candidatus Bathyarchaeota archaeon]|nr:MBL fold metallo-hydrolase [Candidatus Bathyarchaeota archaeon]
MYGVRGILSKANVTKSGAVLLGKQVACDAFNESRPIRVVTHAHADHMVGIGKSLKNCEVTIMTPATKDMIDALKGPRWLTRGAVKTLDYGEAFMLENETLTLHYAEHILGTAQVLVEDKEQTRILYTSDFRYSRTPLVETDILVMEATYGDPIRVRPFSMMVEGMLVSLVEQGLKRGPVYVFGYHGKLQKMMRILHEAKIKNPFIVPKKIFEVSKVCERHGMKLGKQIIPFDGDEAQSILTKNEPSIVFYHSYSRKKVESEALQIHASGWEFRKPCRRLGENKYVVALSDHSDFNELLEYVERCNPKMVITDRYRSEAANIFAREIEKRLKIPAQAAPI